MLDIYIYDDVTAVTIMNDMYDAKFE